MESSTEKGLKWAKGLLGWTCFCRFKEYEQEEEGEGEQEREIELLRRRLQEANRRSSFPLST